jgi:hypothetical protein
MILQDPDNKGDDLQDIQNAGVSGFFGAFRVRTQACGWWILSRPKINDIG